MSPDIVQLCLPRAKDMWLALVVAVTLSLGSEYTHWLSEELYSIRALFLPSMMMLLGSVATWVKVYLSCSIKVS